MNYEFENESECIKHFTIKILTHHVYILYCIVFIVLFSILGTHTYTTFYFLRPSTCLKNSCNTCCYFLFSHYNVVNVPILQRFQQLRFHPSCLQNMCHCFWCGRIICPTCQQYSTGTWVNWNILLQYRHIRNSSAISPRVICISLVREKKWKQKKTQDISLSKPKFCDIYQTKTKTPL